MNVNLCTEIDVNNGKSHEMRLHIEGYSVGVVWNDKVTNAVEIKTW